MKCLKLLDCLGKGHSWVQTVHNLVTDIYRLAHQYQLKNSQSVMTIAYLRKEKLCSIAKAYF